MSLKVKPGVVVRPTELRRANHPQSTYSQMLSEGARIEIYTLTGRNKQFMRLQLVRIWPDGPSGYVEADAVKPLKATNVPLKTQKTLQNTNPVFAGQMA